MNSIRTIVTLMTFFVSLASSMAIWAEGPSDEMKTAKDLTAERILRLAPSENYQILGLSEQDLKPLTNPDFKLAIKRAYLNRIKTYHPDKNAHPKIEEISKKINGAKDVLLKEAETRKDPTLATQKEAPARSRTQPQAKNSPDPSPKSYLNDLLDELFKNSKPFESANETSENRKKFIEKMRSILTGNYDDQREAYGRVSEFLKVTRSYESAMRPTDSDWISAWREIFNYKKGLNPHHLKFTPSEYVFLSLSLFLVKDQVLSDRVKLDIATLVYGIAHYNLIGSSYYKALEDMESLLNEIFDQSSESIQRSWKKNKEGVLRVKCERMLFSLKKSTNRMLTAVYRPSFFDSYSERLPWV